MADTSQAGIFSLKEVRIRQSNGYWPNVGVSTEVALSAAAGTTVPINTNDTVYFHSGLKNKVTPGSFVYWAIASNTASFSASDFTDSTLNGALTANANGEVSLFKTITFNPARTSNVVFSIKLMSAPINGPILVTSSNILLSNTLLTFTIPGPPLFGRVLVTSKTSANVSFYPPINYGNLTISSYTVNVTPGGATFTGNTSPIAVTGLTTGSSYTFNVTATNSLGAGPATVCTPSTPIFVVPGAPTIGTATANGLTGANVTYTAPADNGGNAIISYTATANVGGISATVNQSGSGLISIPGLTTGTSYSFTVTATNAAGTGANSAVSNGVTPVVPPGSQSFTTAGTFSFIPTSPSVSVVAVGGGGGGGYTWSSGGGGGGGLGWKNNIPVTPGTPYTVVVGAGGPSTPNAQNACARGSTSYFIDTSTVAGYGGGQGGGGASSPAPGYGGGYTGDGGGRGGNGAWCGSWNYGGAGAGGYAGAGADTSSPAASPTGIAAPAGGGGGGGGWYSSTYGVPAGGGVGILGQGCPGGKVNSYYYGGLGGSGGAQGTGGEGSGQSSLRGITGGAYGGGGGGSGTSYGGGAGGVGAVRIIWGAGRAFPTTSVSSP
jgi:hypothetical protein